jgi:integrase
MTIDVRQGVKGTRYHVRVLVKDPKTGEWVTIHGGTFNGRREAERAERELLRERDRHRIAPGGSKTLASYLEEEWLPDTIAWSKRPRPLAATTSDKYRRAVGKIVAEIGDVKLVDGRAVHAERLRAALLSSGLQPQTVGDTMKILGQGLARAVAKGYIGTNWAAADVVDRPSSPPRELPAVSPEVAARLFAAARGTDPWEPAVALALGVGLRREETLALVWSDLADGIVHVRRALTWAEGAAHVGEPKSSAGARRIPMPSVVASSLERHRIRQGERLLAIGHRVEDGDLVVDDGLGRAWTPATFSTNWRRWATAHGFAGLTYHGLRHGFATLMLANGTPDAVAAKLMGHADVRVLSRYQHVLEQATRDAADRMDAVLGGSS